MKLLPAALTAGSLLFSTQAYAEVTPGTHQMSAKVGLVHPLSNDTVDGQSETFGDLGPEIGFEYLYQLHRYLSAGGDFNYKMLGERDVTTGHGPVAVKAAAWTLLAIGRFGPFPDGAIRPYGLLGLGLGGVKRSVYFDQRPDLNSSRNANGIACALGGGVDYDLNTALLIGAELRYNIIGTSESKVGTSSVSTLDVLFKAGFKFGGEGTGGGQSL